ncbi:MAG: ParB/RepB/Spo0J family partition protein [Gemmatimonadaceae bacterium]|nr:ParB/RepB/Spo0J family partition protein [Gemmatimonadaceae bacterium]
MSADTPRRLGRGLEALISTARQQRENSAPASDTTSRARSELQTVRITDIAANRFQPRRTFTESGLRDLEASIRASGLLQPITVRAGENGGWELVAGERRLRAATRLGWTEIPAVVRDFDDRAMLTLALVENLQRADLNPLEEADGYQRLIAEFGLTQQQVADAVGKDRTTITNLLRVLTLPAAVRALVENGEITAAHARALLPLRNERQQVELANEIIARHLSVRDVESRAREMGGGAKTPRSGSPAARKQPTRRSSDPATKQAEERLRRRLQTDVTIQQSDAERGIVRIAFYGADDLDRLLELVLGPAPSDFE